ncbi:hypothetical protein [Mammaliicoccus stepanovicii]|nr:hypothetical protein [Mammaliicoccus stepanovicii]PNZ78972.1 hypothetical protein CD111_01570 [Mammaliicoccus stepanovicii]GGI43359.1 hypothetical protein GCM10010896_23030 [Mammaliicoccus stepanovicii]
MAFGAEMIVHKQNKVVKTFLSHSAINKASAMSLIDLNIKQKRTLHNLLKQGVIKQVDHQYYLDEHNWNKFKKSLKRFFLI